MDENLPKLRVEEAIMNRVQAPKVRSISVQIESKLIVSFVVQMQLVG